MKKKLILDYDGTATEIEKDSEEFREIYPKVCFDLLNSQYMYSDKRLNYHLFNQRYLDLKEGLLNHPERGFVINGGDSLPATADPYIHSQSAMSDLILEVNPDLFSDEKYKTDFLIQAYQLVNQKIKSGSFFREGFRDFLLRLGERYDYTFVTNSGSKKIEGALKAIGIGNVPIVGNAKKLFVDNDFEFVPISIRPEGFPRDVSLRRKFYYDCLDLLNSEGYIPEDTIVVGDIYELDLALPEYLGYGLIQIDNGYAQKHEIDYMGKNFVYNLKGLEKILLN